MKNLATSSHPFAAVICSRSGYLRAQQDPAIFSDSQDAALGVEVGPQLRQLFFAHQHGEMCLGQPLRVLRIEAGRTECNGKTPTVRQAFTGRENYPIPFSQRSGPLPGTGK